MFFRAGLRLDKQPARGFGRRGAGQGKRSGRRCRPNLEACGGADCGSPPAGFRADKMGGKRRGRHRFGACRRERARHFPVANRQSAHAGSARAGQRQGGGRDRAFAGHTRALSDARAAARRQTAGLGRIDWRGGHAARARNGHVSARRPASDGDGAGREPRAACRRD